MRLPVVITTLFLFAAPAAAGSVRDDGIHTQPWINGVSFLDLRDDLADALDAGKKGLAVLFEQKNCPACEKLHEVNFADPGIVEALPANFDVIQINTRGFLEVTDFDGETAPERDFSNRMRATFTPTTVFYGEGGKELFRIPGYLEPDDYAAIIDYVIDGGPERGESLARWSKKNRP